MGLQGVDWGQRRESWPVCSSVHRVAALTVREGPPALCQAVLTGVSRHSLTCAGQGEGCLICHVPSISELVPGPWEQKEEICPLSDFSPPGGTLGGFFPKPGGDHPRFY